MTISNELIRYFCPCKSNHRPPAAFFPDHPLRFRLSLRRERLHRLAVRGDRAGRHHSRGRLERRTCRRPKSPSWVFGVFFVNGLITILFCWLYRQPLAFFWTIPGTVLVGPVADTPHLSARWSAPIYATGAADARPRPDGLGAAGHGPRPDADRDGHGRRRVPAFWPRPRPGALRRRRNSRTDGRCLARAVIAAWRWAGASAHHRRACGRRG